MQSFELDSARFSVGTRALYSLNSTVFTNRFFYRLLDGNHIADRDLDRMKNRAGFYNNLGFTFDVDAYAAFKPDSLFKNSNASTTFFVKISDRQLANARFSNQMAQFALKGNQSFAGKKANFNNFDLEFSRFQQFQVGSIFQLDSLNSAGISLSFLNGEQNQQIKTDDFDVFTEWDGNSITAEGSLTIQQSDTDNVKFLANNGWGFSTDFFYEMVLKTTENSKQSIRFEATDLGFIQWNQQSVDYTIDTSYTFDGVYIDDIFDLNDSILSAARPDSIIDEFTGDGTKGSYSYFLPVRLAVEYTSLQQDGSYYKLGALYRFKANMLPYIYGQYGRKIKPNWELAGNLGLGGYGIFNLGVSTRVTYAGFDFMAATNNLEGVVVPMFSGGTSLFLAIQKKF